MDNGYFVIVLFPAQSIQPQNALYLIGLTCHGHIYVVITSVVARHDKVGIDFSFFQTHCAGDSGRDSLFFAGQFDYLALAKFNFGGLNDDECLFSWIVDGDMFLKFI